MPDDVLRCGTLEARPEGGVASLDGRDLHLTPSEFGVLVYMMRHAGCFLPDWQIAEATGISRSSMGQVIRRLRKKMGEWSRIETRYGFGYRVAK